MTQTVQYATRRQRRSTRTLSRAVADNAGIAGRTTAAVLAASGLVMASGVAANAAEAPVEGREVSTIEVKTSEIDVERASQETQVSVSASSQAELSFDRPAVTSQAAPEPTPEPAPVAEQGEALTSETSATESASSSEATVATSESSTESSVDTEPAAGANSGGVVGAAYAALGVPYSWGGMSTSGFDCSGLINWAYAQAGAGSVPRTTHGMIASLPRVSTPQPGDIVIGNGASHGGIYIGNGQMISATSSVGVRVHPVNDSWHSPDAFLRPGG